MVGLTKVQICNMENHNEGLDSIERRKTLTTILKIPPALLGLASLDEIVEIVTGQEQNPGKTKRAKITLLDIKKYQERFKVYDALFAEGATYGNVAAIEHTIARIRDDLGYANAGDKDELLRILWNFEILCSKVYGSDIVDWGKTFEHIDNAIEIAAELNDNDLQAISLYTSGLYHLRQGRLGLTKVDVESALSYAGSSSPQTKGIVYTLSSWYQRLTGNSLVSQKIFDTAEKYAGIKSEIAPIKFGKGTYLLYRGETLIHLKRPMKALEFLDDAERYIGSSKRRLLVYLDILRAECYIEMKKPEYEQAVCLHVTGRQHKSGTFLSDSTYAEALDALVICCADAAILHQGLWLIARRAWERILTGG